MNDFSEAIRSYINAYGISALKNCQTLIGYVKDICPREKKYINCLTTACRNGLINPFANSSGLSDVQKQSLIASTHTQLMKDIGLSKDTADDFVDSLIYGLMWSCHVPNTVEHNSRPNSPQFITQPAPKPSSPPTPTKPIQTSAPKTIAPPKPAAKKKSSKRIVLIACIVLVGMVVSLYGSGVIKLTVDNTVRFGSYEQDNVSENGPEPIEWIILEEDNDSQLLVSKYILDNRPYQNDYEDITWEESDLREWLNNEFYSVAFSDEEKVRIVPTQTLSSVIDRVYLMKVSEFEEYTPITYNGGRDLYCLNTQYVQETYGEYDKTFTWWLLTENKEVSSGAWIPSNAFRVTSMKVTANYGVRPMIRISK